MLGKFKSRIRSDIKRSKGMLDIIKSRQAAIDSELSGVSEGNYSFEAPSSTEWHVNDEQTIHETYFDGESEPESEATYLTTPRTYDDVD